MTKVLLAGAATLGARTDVALAPPPTSRITPTIVPAPGPLPSGTVSTTTIRHSVAAGGIRTEATRKTYGNSNGVASNRMTRMATVPPPAVDTTREKIAPGVTRQGVAGGFFAPACMPAIGEFALRARTNFRERPAMACPTDRNAIRLVIGRRFEPAASARPTGLAPAARLAAP